MSYPYTHVIYSMVHLQFFLCGLSNSILTKSEREEDI